MGLSYILMLVAFYVDNGKQLPLWKDLPHFTYWLIPMAVGIPLIIRALLWPQGDRLEGCIRTLNLPADALGLNLLGLLEGLMQGRGIPAVRAEASSNAEVFYLRRGYERADPPTSEGAQPIRKQPS